MSTVKEVIERLSKMDADAVISVPAIWEKDTAEEIFEYIEGTPVSLSDSQWVRVVAQFENADFYDESAIVDAIKFVYEEDEES